MIDEIDGMHTLLCFATLRMGPGSEVCTVLGDFRFTADEIPLKAYALASALILFSCSGSTGTLGMYEAGVFAPTFFGAILSQDEAETRGLVRSRRTRKRSSKASGLVPFDSLQEYCLPATIDSQFDEFA